MTITKEGTLASFYTVNKAPIKHLKVYFSPKQAGEGNPSPSNVREIEGWNGVEVKHTEASMVDFSNEPVNLTTLKTMPAESWMKTNNLIYYSVDIDNTNGTSNSSIGIQTYKNDVLLFTGGSLIVPPGSQKKLEVFFTPILYGDFDTISFKITGIKQGATYSNPQVTYKHIPKILPYHGQTYSATFPALGKNLLNEANRLTLYNQQIIYGRDSFSTTNPNGSIYLSAGTYTFSSNKLMQMFAVTNYQGSMIGGIQQNIASYTFTLEEDGPIAIAIVVDSIDGLTCQLEAGSTATAYEPFNNTIYGGYVDLVTGELVQTFGSFTVNDNTYINTSTTRPTNWLRINLDQANNNHAPKILPYTSVTDRGELCNKLEASFQTPQPQDRLITQFGAYENKVFYNSIYIYNLGVSYSSLTTAEQCVNYIKELKPTFVYPIATPITYQLTPQQLQTFIGQNNIWSNADRVEVEYDLAESNDELYRRRNQILKASPHLVSVASGNTVDSEAIAHFITNDTLPLKSCIVDIQPFQSGSGTPSPENIREIKGWDNIELTRCGKNLLNVTNSMYTKEGISVTKNINTNGSITSFSVNGSTTSSNWFENLTYIPNKYNAFFGNFTISTNHPSMPIVIARNSEVYRNNLSLKDASEYTINFSKLLINSTDISTWYRLECWPRDNTTKTVSGEVYPMIRFPDDEGTFEPYNGQTITINLSETIYGGQLNLLTGELTVDYKLCTITGEESGLIYNWDGALLPVSDSLSSNNTYIIKACSHTNNYITGGGFFNSSRSTNPNTTVNDVCVSGSQGSQLRFRKRDLDPDFTKDVELYRTWLRQQNANDTPLQIVYKLQTPQTYQLTPQQIRTLRGVNNIWSNAGPVSLQYWTH